MASDGFYRSTRLHVPISSEHRQFQIEIKAKIWKHIGSYHQDASAAVAQKQRSRGAATHTYILSHKVGAFRKYGRLL